MTRCYRVYDLPHRVVLEGTGLVLQINNYIADPPVPVKAKIELTSKYKK